MFPPFHAARALSTNKGRGSTTIRPSSSFNTSGYRHIPIFGPYFFSDASTNSCRYQHRAARAVNHSFGPGGAPCYSVRRVSPSTSPRAPRLRPPLAIAAASPRAPTPDPPVPIPVQRDRPPSLWELALRSRLPPLPGTPSRKG